MATARKHAERSKYSYHNTKPFADFARRANIKDARKDKESVLEHLKAMFHRTTSK